MAEKLTRSDRWIYAAFGWICGFVLGAPFVFSTTFGNPDLRLTQFIGLGAGAVVGLILGLTGWFFGEWTVGPGRGVAP